MEHDVPIPVHECQAIARSSAPTGAMTRPDWWKAIDTAPAAREIARWLKDMETKLQDGNFLDVKRDLRDPSWLTQLDLKGIPTLVLQETMASIRMALSELLKRGRSGVPIALRWLKRAQAFYPRPR